jgi:site-specific recombinase XerD
MRLQDATDRLVDQLRADGRSPHTVGSYQRHLAALARWLAREARSDELAEILPETLAAFLNAPEARQSVHGGPKRTSSANAVRTSLRVAFGWFHQAGLVAANPARLVRRAICSPPPPRALSDQAVERLMDALVVAQGLVARRDHLLVDLILATGVRLGSALAIDVGDIDIVGSQLRLRRVKGDRVERVFLSRDLRDHLIGYLAGKPGSGPLFRGPRGERLTQRQARRRIKLWMARAGIDDGTPHGLRHTMATRLLRRTGDLFLVKAALLHRSITSTQIYLSVEDDRLRAAMGAQ